ncbi:TPA: hypothetical protein ACPFO4_003698 [Serratia marcescens]|uniref:hypothetical protein n=1 Tax=Gammaproteobacteria TaxID=1236 RepID=UPI0021112E45|nr:hypothetical protein [Stutzerimonas stutzeri]
MRNTITVTAIAITLASGLSFAAADKADQSHSETGIDERRQAYGNDGRHTWNDERVP